MKLILNGLRTITFFIVGEGKWKIFCPPYTYSVTIFIYNIIYNKYCDPLFTLQLLYERLLGCILFNAYETNSPNMKRHAILFAFMVYFLHFKANNEHEKEKKEWREQLQTVTKQNEDLKSVINRMKEEKTEQEKLVGELKHDIESIKKENEKLKEEKGEKEKLVEENNTLKRKIEIAANAIKRDVLNLQSA